MPGLGLDVEDARRLEPVLRRQGAGDQRNAAGEARLQRLAEDGKPLGQFDAIDAILHIGVVAAHVDLAEAVLRDAGSLQQHLVERRVFTLRDRLQRLLIENVGARAEARLNLQARDVQLLRDDIDRFKGDRVAGRRRARGRIGSQGRSSRAR